MKLSLEQSLSQKRVKRYYIPVFFFMLLFFSILVLFHNRPEITFNVNPLGAMATLFLIFLAVLVLLIRESTRRRALARRLSFQEGSFRDIMKGLMEGVIVTGVKGEITYINEGARLLTGWAPGDAVNPGAAMIRDIFTEEAGRILTPLLHILLIDKISFRPQQPAVLHPAFSEKQAILSAGYPLLDEDGFAYGSVLIFQEYSQKTNYVEEIMEARESERMIRQSEERYRALIEQASDAIIIGDADGRIIETSHAASRLFGYSPGHFTGMNIRELYCIQDLDEKQMDLQELFENKVPSREIRMLRRKGEPVTVEMTAKLLSDGRFIAIFRDISERKKAEREIKDAVDRYDIVAMATSDTIWDWDLSNNTKLYSPAIKKMFGYDERWISDDNQWLNEKIHPDDLAKVKEQLQYVIENKIPHMQLEYRFLCADGTYKYIYDRAYLLYDSDRRPVRIIGAMQDVTRSREDERYIAKAIMDAQENERRHIGQELHDNVNQLLASAQLSLCTARDYYDDIPKVNELINLGRSRVHEAIDEIRKLSHQLAPAVFDDVPLKDVFRELIQKSGICESYEVQYEFDNCLNDAIQEEVTIHLYRIMQEQLKNIVQYARARRIHITMKKAGAILVFSIRDDGDGFDLRTVGRGIGLNNIRKRVESLTGKLTIDTSPGNGCLILVELPLALS